MHRIPPPLLQLLLLSSSLLVFLRPLVGASASSLSPSSYVPRSSPQTSPVPFFASVVVSPDRLSLAGAPYALRPTPCVLPVSQTVPHCGQKELLPPTSVWSPPQLLPLLYFAFNCTPINGVST
mmetsp:Transcript_7237/g.18808  ORF Transcript_7237/g.18808 Transcript_7237/m.18808 type:complete len:123 (-) Transcript_7237:380-748(-)